MSTHNAEYERQVPEDDARASASSFKQGTGYVSPGAAHTLREAAKIITWNARRSGKGLSLPELEAMTLLVELARQFDGSACAGS